MILPLSHPRGLFLPVFFTISNYQLSFALPRGQTCMFLFTFQSTKLISSSPLSSRGALLYTAIQAFSRRHSGRLNTFPSLALLSDPYISRRCPRFTNNSVLSLPSILHFVLVPPELFHTFWPPPVSFRFPPIFSSTCSHLNFDLPCVLFSIRPCQLWLAVILAFFLSQILPFALARVLVLIEYSPVLIVHFVHIVFTGTVSSKYIPYPSGSRA